MQTIGPSTGLPLDMVTRDVILCLGEEEDEFEDALDAADLGPAPLRTHHRSFHGRVRDGILCLDGALGSPLVEKCMWELLRTRRVERILLVGTAGGMPGFSGDVGRPYRASPAMSVYQNFDAPPNMSWEPTWALDMEDRSVISTDRFYGFSSHIEDGYPAEPGLLEAWHRHQDVAMVDMEVAAFYHYIERFQQTPVQYAAIKAVANPVSDLDALTHGSASALSHCVQAAVDAIRA